MKDKLSREGAVRILNRWKDGSTRISGSISSGGVLVGFIGYISEVAGVAFRIVQSTNPAADQITQCGEILVDMIALEECEADYREDLSVSALQIHLAPFITCVMVEYPEHIALPKYKM
jgi:hypothetical protein